MADVTILVDGYVHEAEGELHVGSTVSLVRDGDAEVVIDPGVTVMETPGHTREDITTLVETDAGVIAFTHLWWSEEDPADDPSAFDRAVLLTQRERVLAVASRIVPGHGPAFTPGPDTPR